MYERELLPWGVQWSHEIPYGRNSCCPNPDCDWEVKAGDVTAFYNIVGFSCDVSAKFIKPGVIGLLIYECPLCFSHFWLHTSASINNGLMQLLPDWPQVENDSLSMSA